MATRLLIGRGNAIASASATLRRTIALRGVFVAAAVRAAAEFDLSDDRLLGPALALLPPGEAFRAPPGTVLRRVVDALARSLARVQRQLDAADKQLVPGAIGELLSDWERFAGLEDLCAGLSDQERAVAIADRLAPSRPFSWDELLIRAQAADDTFETLSVEQGAPFEAGLSRAGDPVGGAQWGFFFRATLHGSWSASSDETLAALVADRCALFFAWLRRVWPPWCGLNLWVAQDAPALTVLTLTLHAAQN